MMCQIRKEGDTAAIHIPHAANALKGQTVAVYMVRETGEFKVVRESIERTSVGTAQLSLSKFQDMIRKNNKVAEVTIADPDSVIVNLNPWVDEIL